VAGRQPRPLVLPCQHPGRSKCLAAPRASGMRDASDRLVPSHVSYEHPRPVGSRCVTREAPASSGRSPASRRAISLWRARTRCPQRTRGPVRRVRAEPLASLSLPVRCGRSRGRVVRTGCRDRGLCGRVNAVLPPTIRNAFHRSGALAPRRPFGRPAKASCEPRGLATPRPTVDAFGAGEPCGTPALDPRSRTSLPGRSRFSGSRRRPSTSATVTTRGHTRRARSNLARERRFHAAHVRHQRMPVASATPLRCRSGAPASPDPYATTCVRCVPLDVERGSRVEVCERSSARGRTTLRAALLGLPQHPSHRHGSSRILDLFRDLPHRPRIVSETASRKEARRTNRGAFAVPEPIRERRWLDRLGARPDRSPVTPPPQRHCSRVSHAFVATPERLPLTRQAREEARSTAP